MIRLLLALPVLLALASPAAADCAERAPYYHKSKAPSIGAALADLFLLPGSLAVTILTVPVYKRTSDGTVTSNAACMPMALASHIVARERWEPR